MSDSLTDRTPAEQKAHAIMLDGAFGEKSKRPNTTAAAPVSAPTHNGDIYKKQHGSYTPPTK